MLILVFVIGIKSGINKFVCLLGKLWCNKFVDDYRLLIYYEVGVIWRVFDILLSVKVECKIFGCYCIK